MATMARYRCSSSCFPCVGVRLIYWALRSTATFVICFHRSLLLAFSLHFSSSSAFVYKLCIIMSRTCVEQALKSNQATPIFQAHGKDDFTVPYAFGLMTSKLLKQTNPNCEFRSYPNMAHSSCEQASDTRAYRLVFVSWALFRRANGNSRVGFSMDKTKLCETRSNIKPVLKVISLV